MRALVRGFLIFSAGALVGLALGFHFGVMKLAEKQVASVATTPKVPAETTAPPVADKTEGSPAKPSVEGLQTEEGQAAEVLAQQQRDQALAYQKQQEQALRDQQQRMREQQPKELRDHEPSAPVQAPQSQASSKQVAPAVPEPIPPKPPVAVVPLPPSGLLIPVEGVKASRLTDTFDDSRGHGRVHDAIDIMAPKGTPVLAAQDGRIVKLFRSDAGGITIYQFDRSEKFTYYYAHLKGYAPDIVEGKKVKRGDLIGYVGSTGNASANAPHLHFAIFVLGPKKRWWEGTAINPYPLLTGR